MITEKTIQVLQKRRQELLSKQESLSKTRWNYEYKKRLKEVDYLINACNDKNWLLNPSERELLIAFQSWQFDKGYLYQKNLQNGMIEEFLKSNL